MSFDPDAYLNDFISGQQGGSGTDEAAVGPSAGTQQPLSGSLVPAQPSSSGTSTDYSQYIQAASKATGVPVPLIQAVMGAESSGNPTAVNSQSGATGLMQLMPATAKSLGVTDLTDPEQNITAGAKYLAQGLKASGGDITNALKYYYAGPDQANWGANTNAYPQKVLTRLMPLLQGSANAPSVGASPGQETAFNEDDYLSQFTKDNAFDSDAPPPAEQSREPPPAATPAGVPLSPTQAQQLQQIEQGNISGAPRVPMTQGQGTASPQASPSAPLSAASTPQAIPAPAAPPVVRPNINSGWDGSQEWANSIGLGVPKYLAAGLGAVGGMIQGQPLGGTYTADLGVENAAQKSYEAQHPGNAFLANAVGPVPAMVAGGGAISGGLRAAADVAPYAGGVLRYLAGDAEGVGGTLGSMGAKAFNGALTGSTMGAAASLTSPLQGSASRNAITGGALGAVAGGAAGILSPSLSAPTRALVNDLENLGVKVPIGQVASGPVASAAGKAGTDTLQQYTQAWGRQIGHDSPSLTSSDMADVQSNLGDSARAVVNGLSIDSQSNPNANVRFLSGLQNAYTQVLSAGATRPASDIKEAASGIGQVMNLAMAGDITGREVGDLLSKGGIIWNLQHSDSPFVQQAGTQLRTAVTEGLQDTAAANGKTDLYNSYMDVRNQQRIAATLAPIARAAGPDGILNPKAVATAFKNERPGSNAYTLAQGGKILPTPAQAAAPSSPSMLHRLVRVGASAAGASLGTHLLGPETGIPAGIIGGYAAEEAASAGLHNLANSNMIRNSALHTNPFSSGALVARAPAALTTTTAGQLHPNAQQPLENPYVSVDNPDIPLQ